MHSLLWLHTYWSPFWLIVCILVSLVIMFRVAVAFGILLLALVGYAGFAWDPWLALVPSLFWLGFWAAVVGLLWGLLNGGGRWLAMLGACSALFVSVLLVNSDILGTQPPQDRPDSSITEQPDPSQVDLNEERNLRIQNDNDVRRDFDRLTKRMNHLDNRMDRLESRLVIGK